MEAKNIIEITPEGVWLTTPQRSNQPTGSPDPWRWTGSLQELFSILVQYPTLSMEPGNLTIHVREQRKATVLCAWKSSPDCTPVVYAGDPVRISHTLCPACEALTLSELES